jgi:hypothetical protein
MSIGGSCGSHGFRGGCGFGSGCGWGAGGSGCGAGAGGSGWGAGGVTGGFTGFGVGAGAGSVGAGAGGAGATGSGADPVARPSTSTGAAAVAASGSGAGAGAETGRGVETGRARVRVVQWRRHRFASTVARSLGDGAGGRFGREADCSVGWGRDGEDVDVMALPPAKSAAPVTITAPTALRNVAFTRFPPREKSDRTHRAAASCAGAPVSGRS